MTNERVRRHPEEFRRIAVERFKSCDCQAFSLSERFVLDWAQKFIQPLAMKYAITKTAAAVVALNVSV